MEQVHELKIYPEYFKAVESGNKTFEIRKNDRQYQVGDILILNEYDGSNYTGEKITVQVTYITNYEQKDDYVVLAIQKVPNSLTTYITLTEKEKDIFAETLSYYRLYEKDHVENQHQMNLCSQIIEVLFKQNCEEVLGDIEETWKWYSEFWKKEGE